MNNFFTDSSKRKILFLTGTRADFGKLKPLIRKVEESDGYDAYIFATGMHMLSRYGSTVNEIYKEGFSRIFPYVNQDGAVNSQMDLVLANTVTGLGHYIREFRPDLIVVHGDRIEALAGAIVGSLNNILVAHIEGGELSGTIDELIRHSVSKLSHLHFVANAEASTRLLQMGEIKETIFVIGSPDIDIMLSQSIPDIEEVKRKYNISFEEYGIFIYHPVLNELDLLRSNIETVITSIMQSGDNFVVIHPNNDKGSEIIMEALSERLCNNSRFRLLPSMRFEYFLGLLKNAKVIVGNSSAGIREAPVYGVPTINIGTRQMSRFKYPSIIDVGENLEEILSVMRSLPNAVPKSNHFGNGNSAELFIDLLKTPEVWNISKQKLFRDL